MKKLIDEMYKEYFLPAGLSYSECKLIVSLIVKKLGYVYSNEDEFRNIAETMIRYINENHHPHTTVIVTTDKAEIVEGVKTIITDKFIPD